MELTGIDNTNREYFKPLMFGEHSDGPSANIIEAGVIEGGSPVSAAVLEVDWKTKNAIITSVYTLEKHRGKGAARMAVEALIKAAKALKMNTLTCYGTSGMNGLYEFLHAMGFDLFLDGDEEVYSVSDLMSSERVKRFLTKDYNTDVSKLGELNEPQKDDIRKKLDTYPPIGIDESTDNELSMAVMNEMVTTDLTKAVLITSREEEDVSASVDFVAAFTSNLMDVAALFVKFFKGVSENPDLKTISFLPVNPQIEQFIGSMAYHTKGQSVYHGVLQLK